MAIVPSPLFGALVIHGNIIFIGCKMLRKIRDSNMKKSEKSGALQKKC
jgi:hypothetical protein